MADGVTGKGRHHEAAPIAVDVVIHDEYRGVSKQSRQHRIRLAGMEHRRISGEDGLDVGGVGEIDHCSHRGDAQREHIPVSALAGGHQARPVAQHQRCLYRAGQRWTRRQPGPH